MVVACTIFFSTGEYAARLWTAHFGDALDLTRGILIADPLFGWRQKSGLNADFLGFPLVTNELGWRTHPVSSLKEASTTVLILGPSSSFGWGVPANDTYAMQLESILKASSSAVVLNAGEIGFSSFQGLRLYSEPAVRSLSPEVVVIAYGVNDTDRSRFIFQSDVSDAQEFSAAKPTSTVAMINTLRESALWQLLLKLTGTVRAHFVPPPVSTLISSDPVPGVRVPQISFVENMRSIIHIARQRGATPVLLTTVVRLPSEPVKPRTMSKYEEARSLWSSGDMEGSRDLLMHVTSEDPTLCEAYYYLAAIAVREGDTAQARRYFTSARQYEANRIARDVGEYNSVLISLASQEHVPVVDLQKLFADHDQNSLFVDPIHFSQEGNKLVAEELARIIREQKRLQ